MNNMMTQDKEMKSMRLSPTQETLRQLRVKISMLAMVVCLNTKEIEKITKTDPNKWIQKPSGRYGRYGAGGRPQEDSIQFGQDPRQGSDRFKKGVDLNDDSESFSDSTSERFDNLLKWIEDKQSWAENVQMDIFALSEEIDSECDEWDSINEIKEEMISEWGSCDRGTQQSLDRLERRNTRLWEKLKVKEDLLKEIQDQIEHLEDQLRKLELGEFSKDDMWCPWDRQKDDYNRDHFYHVWADGVRIFKRVVANTALPKKDLSLTKLFAINRWVNETRFGTKEGKTHKRGTGMTYKQYVAAKAELQGAIARIIPDKTWKVQGVEKTNLDIALEWKEKKNSLLESEEKDPLMERYEHIQALEKNIEKAEEAFLMADWKWKDNPSSENVAEYERTFIALEKAEKALIKFNVGESDPTTWAPSPINPLNGKNSVSHDVVINHIDKTWKVSSVFVSKYEEKKPEVYSRPRDRKIEKGEKERARILMCQKALQDWRENH